MTLGVTFLENEYVFAFGRKNEVLVLLVSKLGIYKITQKSTHRCARLTGLTFVMSLLGLYKAHIQNIAKGTTDPRVEFILPKSYRKFKHKS